MSRLEPRLRRSVIMLMDALMVLTAIPLSLLLSNSAPSFDLLSAASLAGWVAIGLFSHVLFRTGGLYRMMWRFASTPDFFNIMKNCAMLTATLYVIALSARSFTPITGLNERQFLVFFFMTFMFIATPRLFYRYLREGRVWSGRDDGNAVPAQKRALFFGRLEEADVIISYGRATSVDPIRVVGIVTNDESVSIGTKIQGVAIVGDRAGARSTLEEYTKDAESLDLLIFGQGAEKAFADFPELVRVARRCGVAVEQFSGLSQMRKSGRLVLEKVEMETILRRTTVSVDNGRLSCFLKGKRVLVTGGAGSIGRILVKRALDLEADAVLVADLSEFNIFQMQAGMEEWKDRVRLTLRILDINDRRQLAAVVEQFRPDIIFHAAALKHVPLLEENWDSAIKTNVFGTLNCVEVAAELKVPHFVLISSDKAADPTSVLGMTKRMAEQIVNAMHYRRPLETDAVTDFIGVRFGNVFGSDGSVATIFQKQIDAGGPVTITDPMMTRYLMTIGEAVDLVMMASAVSATESSEHDLGIYMLDMGEPVSILTVAETMIRLAGKKPYQDIPIVITGKRPGEKLHETLSSSGEKQVNLGVPSVFGLRTGIMQWPQIEDALTLLRLAVEMRDRAAAIRVMKQLYAPLDESAHAAARDRQNGSSGTAAGDRGEATGPLDLTTRIGAERRKGRGASLGNGNGNGAATAALAPAGEFVAHPANGAKQHPPLQAPSARADKPYADALEAVTGDEAEGGFRSKPPVLEAGVKQSLTGRGRAATSSS